MDSNTGVSYGYCKISKNSFLIQHLLWLLLTVLPRQSKASWGACSLILRLPCNFDFDQKLSRNVAQIILYYHVTNQFFVAWFYWSHAFDFRMFWKNINCFPFWWKTYTKRCTSSYVISRVKRLSSPAPFAVGQVLSISENGTWWWKSRFWFCSCLPFILSPVSAVAASCFNYTDPCS